MEIGPRITAWRKLKGFTQQSLASGVGVTVAAVSYWESGTTTPSHDNLKALVELLGLTMEQFYGAIPKPKKTKATKRAVA